MGYMVSLLYICMSVSMVYSGTVLVVVCTPTPCYAHVLHVGCYAVVSIHGGLTVCVPLSTRMLLSGLCYSGWYMVHGVLVYSVQCPML